MLRNGLSVALFKLYLFIGLCLTLFLAASEVSGSSFGRVDNPVDTLRFEPSPEESDTLEYELIIIDVDFDSWFLRNSSPIGFYNEHFLESWNRQLVSQWNNAIVTHPNRDCRPTTYLDYDVDIDYGKELNYKLFYYFKFMQERCRIFLNFPGPGR